MLWHVYMTVPPGNDLMTLIRSCVSDAGLLPLIKGLSQLTQMAVINSPHLLANVITALPRLVSTWLHTRNIPATIRIHPGLWDPRREITLPGSGGVICQEAEDPDALSQQGDLPTGDT